MNNLAYVICLAAGVWFLKTISIVPRIPEFSPRILPLVFYGGDTIVISLTSSLEPAIDRHSPS